VGDADPVAVLRALSGLLSDAAPVAAELERRAAESRQFAEVEVDDEEPPEVVDLELDGAVELRLAELRNAFGEPTEVPPMPYRPPRVAFYVEEPGKPARVAIFASVDEDDEDRVRSLMLRRDEL
jgi:hypothetical protein